MFPEVEVALFSWFLDQRAKHNVVTNGILKSKAMQFYDALDLNEPFNASVGWIENFKKRQGIRLLKICGEKLSCNTLVVPEFLESFKKMITDHSLSPEQIYNADESGLVYKNLNDKTLVHQGEKSAPGRKSQKERVTIMPCANASGNHKISLMLIGKAKKPRCFKNSSLPPVHYRASRNAWQNTVLFKEWFFNIFIPEVKENLRVKQLPQKAVLMLDNATCHGDQEILKSDDGNFTVFFFPPNTTPLLQPMDQHVIKSLKQRYKKRLLANVAADCTDGLINNLKKLNLKDVVFMIVDSWNEVPKSVIMNSWKHLFSSLDDLIFNLPPDHFNDEDDISLIQLYRRIAPDTAISNAEIMDWASGVGEEAQFPMITDDDILNINNIFIDAHAEDIPSSATDINQVINAFNTTLEWAEEINLEYHEVLLLRRLREKAVYQKYK